MNIEYSIKVSPELFHIITTNENCYRILADMADGFFGREDISFKLENSADDSESFAYVQ